MKTNQITLISLSLILSLVLLGGCGKSSPTGQNQGTIQIKGSDTIVNAVQMVSEEFMKQYPEVFVSVTGGGTGVGIASLIGKSCDIASASREMMPKEIAQAKERGVTPIELPVAIDGVALIVNKNNPVEKLTIADLHKIFTGEATNWKDFGGKDLSILTLSREVSSGTHIYFKEEVVQLGDKTSTQEFSSKTLLMSSSQAIVEEIAGNEGAIGYLGMGYVSDRTKTLAVAKEAQFFLPDANTTVTRQYPLSRHLYFYTNGQPQGVVKLFIDFALSPAGQEKFKQAGFVPLGADSAKKN